jgi:hypothetical protein
MRLSQELSNELLWPTKTAVSQPLKMLIIAQSFGGGVIYMFQGGFHSPQDDGCFGSIYAETSPGTPKLQ